MRAFAIIHGLMAVLFACAALMLIVVAAHMGWTAFTSGLDQAAAQELIEAVGLLAAAVVALQIAQTIAEEEVIRAAHISAPTRVRRFLSRFFVVVVVALAIERIGRDIQGPARGSCTVALCSKHPAFCWRHSGWLGSLHPVESFCRRTGARSHGGSQTGRPETPVAIPTRYRFGLQSVGKHTVVWK